MYHRRVTKKSGRRGIVNIDYVQVAGKLALKIAQLELDLATSETLIEKLNAELEQNREEENNEK